jgi:phytoene dehydrogenase-like protein
VTAAATPSADVIVAGAGHNSLITAAFPDGESITMWLDLERTCEEIARFDPEDARSYRRLLADYDAVKDVFQRQRFTPVGWGPSFDELLEGREGAARWRRRAAMSAWEVVRHEFRSRHVRSFMRIGHGRTGTQRGHRDARGLRTGPSHGGRSPGADRQPPIPADGCIIRPCALQ